PIDLSVFYAKPPIDLTIESTLGTVSAEYHLAYKTVFTHAGHAMIDTLGWTLDDWLSAYRDRGANPRDLLASLRKQLRADDPAWIYILSNAELEAQLKALEAAGPEARQLPLYGVPYVVKDNIDVAGLPTTAACPAFTYIAERDATSVARLRAAGAILLAKTNLDQFATGLVGTRSPYGAVPNAFDAALVSGGSSS